MVATNSVTPKTANVSAGTSAFLMAVLERPLASYYKEIDVVTTPDGAPVAMVHVNNFASEITAWTNLFEEVIALGGGKLGRGQLFDALYERSAQADTACGGLVGYNFLAGEPIAGVASGIPMVARTPHGKLTLANFMKMHIYSALGALAMGCEILQREGVRIDSVCGHGGFFKTPVVGQSAMSAAVGAPVTVMKTAGEGGAWGIAVLALFAYCGGGDLARFLDGVFESAEKSTLTASDTEIAAFHTFMAQYKKGLAVEKLASEVL
jgi:sugar (pentulose or hexulose) kinase